MPQNEIAPALAEIFRGITRLQRAFPNRSFTIDGRLVGDIGEVIASIEYDLRLDEVQRPTHDARTSDGRNVQIKVTFKRDLTIRAVPDYYLGFRLEANGDFEEVYNGPGTYIMAEFSHRKGFGTAQLSLPVKRLRELSARVPDHARIPRRMG
jgi:hypothetical protein